MRYSGVILSLALLAGCAENIQQQPVVDVAVPDALPLMRWDHRPEADEWTETTLDALHTYGATLLSEVPNDIGEWCPHYVEADADERAAFWSGVLSTLAKHESTWNPAASGGGGQWIGLVQIAPSTARAYGCEATTAAELKDGAANLACAVKIAAVTVPRDGYVGSGREGLAADWAPFLSSRKRSDMVEWTRNQDYCSG